MTFKDTKVLIIGGTGTIGRKLVEKILDEKPLEVRIFSRDEYKQYKMHDDFGLRNDLTFFIGDVRDYNRVKDAMKDIDYVFHVAAMKHVPACEYNPYEAVLTNIIGSYNVINAAILRDVKKVVFSSSDKAISPTNTYGATKLTVERMIYSTEFNKSFGDTIFSIVRFGNVLGSRGSVIPLFVKQILENKKITVTDFNMTRFMMTLEQASSLMIKALDVAKGGEIFVLKMPVILLKDLAKVVIEETCAKYKLTKDEIKIAEIGLRPGEKMYEELMTYDESTKALEDVDMFIIPSDLNNSNQYSFKQKAKPSNYTSKDQTPITIEEVKKLIKSENLI